ncbi:histidine--tRNA ligase [Candidatus Karelsulcia muelleri]|uniref:Histidine--tRNA ligase n=1 Tax=Candidatus Karelsulcia muelleri PSPU TaxID=1189303 RepID=A0AAD1AY52_9FLAO|nr:histidine--tRNA ligase [Candidatus Karelsulcia muelleri]NJJ98784.1 histidine--tRNA ligase [Candidatus Karelsulcia muelleri]BAO66185.1 histidyl-tRNA synthetase [Candidatus Karelsulcia muelleri PSPU]
MSNISIPYGTRDFSTNEIRKRNYIIYIIKKNFELFGFSPIETTSIENISILKRKYGEEGEKLIFKIINSGIILNYSLLSNKKKIFKKALRYDLTVPLARYVVMNKNKILFPFKRYQIQPVWRAEKPQKGRFREFYQCDVDSIGSKSIWQEIELILLYDKIFYELNLPVIIKFNHIEILKQLSYFLGINKKFIEFTKILDKWEKIGSKKIFKKLIKIGISKYLLKKIFWIFKEEKNILKIYHFFLPLKKCFHFINEIKFIFKIIKNFKLKSSKLIFKTNLARGLNYYTGIIFEVLTENNILSLSGGGRYDNLTKIFGLKKKLSGIGISFGLDRIYISMLEMNLFNKFLFKYLDVIFINFGYNESIYSYKLILELRKNGISSELYPDNIKIKKQLKYANKKKITFVFLIGKKEIKKNKIKVKNLKFSIEKEYSYIDEFIDFFYNKYI